MASPIINYAPVTGLGQKVIAAAVVPVPSPWIPAGIKGFEKRVLPGGAIEMRAVPGSLPDATKPVAAQPMRKDPPYLPPDFGGFEYHSANGKVVKYVRPTDVAPRDPILARLEALDEKLAADDDMLRRLIDHRGGCRCCISPPCNACCEPLTAHEAYALGWLEDDAEAEPITAAPITWQDGAPPSIGWFNARDEYDRVHDATHFVRYWDGGGWRQYCAPDAPLMGKAECRKHRDNEPGIQWRGPRLVGHEWPEATAT